MARRGCKSNADYMPLDSTLVCQLGERALGPSQALCIKDGMMELTLPWQCSVSNVYVSLSVCGVICIHNMYFCFSFGLHVDLLTALSVCCWILHSAGMAMRQFPRIPAGWHTKMSRIQHYRVLQPRWMNEWMNIHSMHSYIHWLIFMNFDQILTKSNKILTIYVKNH